MKPRHREADGAAVAAWRLHARLTQRQLAERLGVAQWVVARIEDGSRPTPAGLLPLIAKELKVTSADLTGEPGARPAPVLFTPEQASERFGRTADDKPIVSASWLRRRAAARAIPCHYMGRRLAFTEQDIEDIRDQFASTPRTTRSRRKPA